MLAFDLETEIDTAQRLTFGSYRVAAWTPDGRLVVVEEGLIHADDLARTDPEGYRLLKEYRRAHRADVGRTGDRSLRLLSRAAFLNEILWPAVEADALMVGFNLPFDLARLAIHWGEARGQSFRGGFSLQLWPGKRKPRLCIRALDSTRAFISFRHPRDGSGHFPGRFLDLRTLTHALTDTKHTLGSACEAFGVEHSKDQAPQHGKISAAYIEYNRHDVRATLELMEKVRAEYDRHPIALAPTQAYSPASIAKAYLPALGITPLADRFPNIRPAMLGCAMTTYYGGRAEGHIRKVVVPVVYLDVLSMYPTVNSLLGLSEIMTAAKLTLVKCGPEVQRLLDSVNLKRCFDPDLWPELRFIAEVEPLDDILPVRAPYRSGSQTPNIALNPLRSAWPLWYTGPDLIAAALLTGKAPRIRRALRLVPQGRAPGLKTVSLRGQVAINPAVDDFFRKVIELRKSEAGRSDPKLGKFLKVLANAGAYGIYAEMNPEALPAGETEMVRVFGLETPFTLRCTAPETPGRYCFPHVAALITGAARLMLALLERCVAECGGTYATCDTDAMTLVALPHGGLVPCPGGPERLPDGRSAIHALSFDEVHEIVHRVESLKPYDPALVPETVLKIEPENFIGTDLVGVQCYAIAAKRYCLFRLDTQGRPVIVKCTEHGLGHLLDPRDVGPAGDRHDTWYHEFWQLVLSRALGLPVAEPTWLDRPAVSKLAITTPEALRPFGRQSLTGPYSFMLSAHVAQLPAFADADRFHLIRAFTRDPSAWLAEPWVEWYSGERYAVTTGEPQVDEARLKTYRDVLEDFVEHPEPKSLGPNGLPCAPSTVGLLHRRPVEASTVVHLGKEANKLEEVEFRLVHRLEDVQMVYQRPGQPSLDPDILRVLQAMPKAQLAQALGCSPRWAQAIRGGRAIPGGDVLTRVRTVAVTEARRLRRLKSTPPDLRGCAERLLATALARTPSQGRRPPREHLRRGRS